MDEKINVWFHIWNGSNFCQNLNMLSVWTFVGYSFVIWLTWGLFLWSNHNVYLWPQNFLFNWNFLVYIKLVNNPKPISGPRNWTIMSVSGARNMLSQKLTLVILGERNFMIRFGLSLNTIDISLITYTCDFWTIYTKCFEKSHSVHISRFSW